MLCLPRARGAGARPTVVLAERRRAPAATTPPTGDRPCAAHRRDRRGARRRHASGSSKARRCSTALRHRRRAGAAGPLPGRGRRGDAIARRAGRDQDRVARHHAQDRRRRRRARTRLARGGGAAATDAMLARVARTRPEARLDGVLVQPMAGGDAAELLLGMVRDPQFGPLVMVGFGGIFVEILGRHRDASGAVSTRRGARDARGAADGTRAPGLSRPAGRRSRRARRHRQPLLASRASRSRRCSSWRSTRLLAGPAGARALDVRGQMSDPGGP